MMVNIKSTNLYELHRILVSNGYRCMMNCIDDDITEITIPCDEQHDVLISRFTNKFYGNDLRIHIDYLCDGIPVISHIHAESLTVWFESEQAIIEYVNNDNSNTERIISTERTNTYELDNE